MDYIKRARGEEKEPCGVSLYGLLVKLMAAVLIHPHSAAATDAVGTWGNQHFA